MANESNKATARGAFVITGLVFLVVLLICGAFAGVKAFNRYQKVQDANTTAQVARITADNQAAVNRLTIAAQEQRVKIAQQEAQITVERAKGIREAQDTISQTLTPLYVQMQLVEAMQQIATSGQNNTVIYIPVGSNGLPLVAIPPVDKNAAPVGK